MTKQEEIKQIEQGIKKESWCGKDLRECSVEEQNDVVETLAKIFELKRMTRTQAVVLIFQATRIISSDRITDIVIAVYEKYTHHKKLHRNIKGY